MMIPGLPSPTTISNRGNILVIYMVNALVHPDCTTPAVQMAIDEQVKV